MCLLRFKEISYLKVCGTNKLKNLKDLPKILRGSNKMNGVLLCNNYKISMMSFIWIQIPLNFSKLPEI
ncbi:hypothetical protein MTR_0425s0010 [Medicago truncatula]|uniref:Uncharacterized protein n=1 Tax=Medicago truncatula TaxID=3880 RepID=A0A072TEH1_MEDTR|nr:hypothetical protein MTR_0425s0010 [Medicago truncatula]